MDHSIHLLEDRWKVERVPWMNHECHSERIPPLPFKDLPSLPWKAARHRPRRCFPMPMHRSQFSRHMGYPAHKMVQYILISYVMDLQIDYKDFLHINIICETKMSPYQYINIYLLHIYMEVFHCNGGCGVNVLSCQHPFVLFVAPFVLNTPEQRILGGLSKCPEGNT